MSGRKWAVENRNKRTGERVRLMETPQRWTADLIAASANAHFVAAGLDVESSVIILVGRETG